MKVSDLNNYQKQHLAWRLDHKTATGLITASAIARGDHGNKSVMDIFKESGCSNRSAAQHVYWVKNYKKMLERKRNKFEREGDFISVDYCDSVLDQI